MHTHAHTQWNIISHKKEWNNATGSNKDWDPEVVRLSEISQTEKDKYHMRSFIHEILKNDRNELIYDPEIDSDIENK